MPGMATKKRVQYDDEFRASAVLMLEAAGWPDKLGAAADVSRRVGVPQQTLTRWATGANNPPPSKIVKHKKLDIQAAIKAELAAIFAAMPAARDGASYRDLGVVSGILVDKLQLLSGEPTQTNDTRILVEYSDNHPAPAASGATTNNP